MDPKRLRLLIIAAAIPIVLVVLVSFAGGGGNKGGGAGSGVVVTRPGGSGGGGNAQGGGTMTKTGGGGITIADLMNTPPPGQNATPTPKLPKPDERVIQGLMDQGERHYMSGDLAQARGYYAKAAQMDPACERCVNKLQKLETQMAKEIDDAFRSADSYMNTGRYDQAIWSLERVLLLAPDPNATHHVNAKTLLQEAQQKKAERGR